MKVGTDALLLGASVDVSKAEKILDVGTGTGLIALMMGQRSRAQIDAVEIDENSFLDANENILASPWKDRISVFHTSFQEFAIKLSRSDEKFDLVISNPPYFHRLPDAKHTGRQMARHQQELSDRDLLYYTDMILKPEGSLWVIKPFSGVENFIKEGELYHLFSVSEIRVRSTPEKDVSRVIVQFVREKKKINTENLVIEKKTGEYSEGYDRLTQEFYL